jgi:NADH-quinone oxidoreductase subunit E
VEVPEGLRAEIEAHMAKYPDRHSAALPALAAAQREHDWCSPEALDQVAVVMGVTPAYLSSLTTFYDMLRTEPVGSRYVYVCTSVSCCLHDAKSVYDAIAAEAREQGLEDCEVREFECLGACDIAPMASVSGRYVGPLDAEDDPRELVAALREGRPVLPGRGLEGSDLRLPWSAEPPPAASAARDDERGISPPTPSSGPEDRIHYRRSDPADPPPED